MIQVLVNGYILAGILTSIYLTDPAKIAVEMRKFTAAAVATLNAWFAGQKFGGHKSSP